MIYPMFVIRDSKIGYLTPIMLENNDATALRNFSTMLADDHSVIKLHASDFSLYRIGSFDTESGIVDSLDAPLFIADAVSIVQE